MSDWVLQCLHIFSEAVPDSGGPALRREVSPESWFCCLLVVWLRTNSKSIDWFIWNGKLHAQWEMRSHYVTQAGVQLLESNDPPASALWVLGQHTCSGVFGVGGRCSPMRGQGLVSGVFSMMLYIFFFKFLRWVLLRNLKFTVQVGRLVRELWESACLCPSALGMMDPHPQAVVEIQTEVSMHVQPSLQPPDSIIAKYRQCLCLSSLLMTITGM